jgi:hypothetical protein
LLPAFAGNPGPNTSLCLKSGAPHLRRRPPRPAPALPLPPPPQIETMHDATCERIRAVAEAHNLPVPDALRPTAIPGPKQMYHVNMSGE